MLKITYHYKTHSEVRTEPISHLKSGTVEMHTTVLFDKSMSIAIAPPREGSIDIEYCEVHSD